MLAWATLIAAHGCSPTPTAPADADATGKPCKSSSDCPTGYCLPLPGEPVGGRAVCTRECTATSSCLSGWACAPWPGAPDLCQCDNEPEACDGKDNDCNGLVDDIDIPANICSPIGLNGGPWACEDGRCTCKPPRVSCMMGAYCSDLQTDRDNCGACDVRCPPGSDCAGGVCVCGAGLTLCPGACVDPKTDSANCNGCGLRCSPAESCVGGACGCKGPAHERCPLGGAGGPCGVDGRCRAREVLQKAPDLVGAIALSATHVFYASRASAGGQSIRGVSKAGSAPEVLVDLAGQYLPSLAADATDLFYGTRGPDAGQDVVVRCPAGRCGPSAVVLATGTTATAMAVKAGVVYWLDGGTGEVKRCAASGCGGAPTVVTSPPSGAAVAPPFSQWEGFLAADATTVFVGYVGGGVIAKAPTSGGTAEKIGQAANVLNGLAINSSTVYFVETAAKYFTTVGVHRIPKAGGAQSLFEATQPGIAIVADDANVYWSVPSLYVFKCATTGCAPRYDLAAWQNTNNVRALALDAQSLYVGGGNLSRMTN
ncbi:MAG: hypothetical protein JST00_04830 [Deltaproteobacteria bacterium]|nr:hypothetical protein [Deltaproteobacteria bacterium]